MPVLTMDKNAVALCREFGDKSAKHANFWLGVQFPLKGTNGRQKTYEIIHVYCIIYSGFMSQTTVIFGITKDGSLLLNTLAS